MQNEKIPKCNHFLCSLTNVRSLEPVYEMLFSNSVEQSIRLSAINQKHHLRESISTINAGCILAMLMCF